MSLAHLPPPVIAELLGAKLKTYSPKGRAKNLDFTVTDLTVNGITFRKQNGAEQTARRAEMDYVSEHWEAVKQGDVTRKELCKRSFNTSYLFGVLHFLDKQTSEV